MMNDSTTGGRKMYIEAIKYVAKLSEEALYDLSEDDLMNWFDLDRAQAQTIIETEVEMRMRSI